MGLQQTSLGPWVRHCIGVYECDFSDASWIKFPVAGSLALFMCFHSLLHDPLFLCASFSTRLICISQVYYEVRSFVGRVIFLLALLAQTDPQCSSSR